MTQKKLDMPYDISGGNLTYSPPQFSTPAIGTTPTSYPSSGFSGNGLFGSLIGGFMNLGSQALSQTYYKKNLKREHELAMQDYERMRQDYLTDLANERAYNSPLAQKLRLLAAGINPNTVFGHGNVGNTSSPAQNKSGIGNYGSFVPSGSLGSEMVDMLMPTINASLSDLQAENLSQDIQNKKAGVLEILSRTKGIDATTKKQMIENGWLDFMYESEINQRYQQISESISRQNAQSIVDAQRIFELYNILPAQRKQILAATNKLYSEIDNISQQTKFLKDSYDDRLKSSHYDMLYKAYNQQLQEFERDIMSTKVPRGAVDNYIQGMFQRLKIVRESIFSIGK